MPLGQANPGERAEEPLVRWLFLDLNSYFASVEQEKQPHLRGRPVAVVPVMADTTCCIAASYEAKAFGVRTGTQVGEAKRLCPGIELVEGRHELYVEYHNRIVEAVEECVPVSTVMSIDEMACRLIGREQRLMTAMEIAQRVKTAIREKVGSTLRCSIGLAPNRYLAKIASDMEKPDGLTALTQDLLPGALLGLTPRDLPGIGARMERRLASKGVRTMADMMALDREQMGEVWESVGGERMWHWLRGEDFHDEKPDDPKSIGHSHVLAPALRTMEGSYAVAHKLLHKAAIRLRKARMWAGHISLTLRFAVPEQKGGKKHFSGIHQRGWSEGLRLVECQDTQTLSEGMRKLWETRPDDPLCRKPFFVGVTLSELVPDHLHSMSLFSALEEEAERARLAVTMDSVNQKYGTNTLYFAGMQLAGAAAPTRIAFTSIPDLF